MNIASLIRAKLHNNAKKLLPDMDVRLTGNQLKLTNKEVEYNTTGVSETSEWVNPYVKLDAKTNRYRKVKGYWRTTTESAREPEKDITGKSSGFLEMSDTDKIRYLFGGKV